MEINNLVNYKVDVTLAHTCLRRDVNFDISEKEFRNLCIQKLQTLFTVDQIKEADRWESEKNKKVSAFQYYIEIYRK